MFADESVPARIQHELLRIAQEAINNAARHAKPTVVRVTLRWDPPNLILQVKDNGSGISSARLEKSDGVGLSSMRDRATQIGAKLEIQTAAGCGTSIILTVPISYHAGQASIRSYRHRSFESQKKRPFGL